MVFMVPLVVALLLVTPHQPFAALGIEFIILGALHGLGLAMIGRGKRESGKESNSHLARLVAVITPNTLTTALVLVGGASVLTGHASGLYFLVAAVVIALIGGVANAWLFLILDRDRTTHS